MQHTNFKARNYTIDAFISHDNKVSFDTTNFGGLLGLGPAEVNAILQTDVYKRMHGKGYFPSVLEADGALYHLLPLEQAYFVFWYEVLKENPRANALLSYVGSIPLGLRALKSVNRCNS